MRWPKACAWATSLQSDEAVARRAWEGIQKQFITTNPDGTLILQGTVKVGGLGGTPYRAGDFNYYIHEPVVDQDKKGVGAFLLAGSEMEQPFNAPIPAKTGLLASSKDFRTGQGASMRSKTALIDAWFNSQTRKNAFGQTELYHYKWDDDTINGYSLFGRAFESYGAQLATLPAAPTAASLAHAQIYVIASPDIPIKNPNPHYMDQASGDAIEAWVKAGGVLMLFSNDRDNTEFDALQHAERPLRHPLQSCPIAPRHRRATRPGEVGDPARHRHLRRGLHGIYERHQHHYRQRPGQGRRHRATATS